jgi:RHS repeat-associated protein
VTVNNRGSYRKGEYFRNEYPIANSAGAVYQSLTNLGVLPNGTSADITVTNVGRRLLPMSPETPFYDMDGNQTGDGLWTNTWSAENRLAAVGNAAGIPTNAWQKETWTYLPDGRWSERILYLWDGSSYLAQTTNRFFWDADALVAILDHTNGFVTSFLRGTNVNGSSPTAGTMSGLLAVCLVSNGNHFCAIDGNDNVLSLVQGTSGVWSGNYEYDPFGNTLRITGTAANANPIRFGTQFADAISADLKYLHRENRPSIGRWLTRDPIEEIGGLNLAAFVANDPILKSDPLGLIVGSVTINPWIPIVKNGGGFLGNKVRGWLFGATWSPPSKWLEWGCTCIPCHKVVWTQDAKFGNGPMQTEWGTADASKYGYAWDCSNPAGKNAAMFDQPDQHGGVLGFFTSPYTFSANSYATCVEGRDAGNIYAIVSWGFTWTKDTTPSGVGPSVW